MTRYQQLEQKALGIAFIAGPLLLTIGALLFLLDIGLNYDGVSSWVEGVFDAYAFLIFVPIYFNLARMLGERTPLFGIICAITGLGIGFGVVPSSSRITQAALYQAGFEVPIFSLSHPGMIPLLLWMFLGIFTSLFLGIGFLRKGGIPRWTAILLILAPILLVIGQGGDETIAWWQTHIFYPLACMTWLVAFGSIGWRYLSGRTDAYTASEEVEAVVV